MDATNKKQQPSLAYLPPDIQIMIVGRVGATSQQPLQDLRSLTATCKNMRRACSSRDVGRQLDIELVREELSWSLPTDYRALLSILNDLSNSEAAFVSGVLAVFGRNENCLNDDPRRATDSGHNAAAYLYAIFLYGANAGTAADDSAKSYMRRVAGGGGGTTTTMRLNSKGCWPLRKRATDVIFTNTWRRWGEPLPGIQQVRGDVRCTGKGWCSVYNGWEDQEQLFAEFCSEDCRLHREMVMLQRAIRIGNN